MIYEKIKAEFKALAKHLALKFFNIRFFASTKHQLAHYQIVKKSQTGGNLHFLEVSARYKQKSYYSITISTAPLIPSF